MKLKLVLLSTAFVALESFAASVQPLALAQFTYAGRITDYANIGYDGKTPAEIRAYDQDGVLLAKATTTTTTQSPYNYVLDIPVATQDIPGYATVGESLVFVIIDPDGKRYAGLVAGKDCVVGNPGELNTLDFVLATDTNNDGVPDAYEDMLSYYMWKNGIDEYKADEDYDGDGISNFEEYVAGTNPFDPTDFFRITHISIERDGMEYAGLRFLANQGRSYGLLTTLNLANPDWHEDTFALEPGQDEQLRLNTSGSETGYKTIYILLDEHRSRFWRMTME